MADKIVKAKQPEGTVQVEKVRQPEKPKPVQKTVAKPAEKDREKPKQPSSIQRWYRETLGELRKVTWPTPQDTWRLTRIVLLVMFVMAAVLGLLDYVFSYAITHFLFVS